MRVDWSAVVTGFAIAFVLGLIIAFLIPITAATVWLLAVPGLVGGFAAGYIVRGGWNGAVNGGLATVFGALIWLIFLAVGGLFFAGIFPTLGVVTIGLLGLFVQAIPGAIAGALGGWWKEHREEPPAATTG